MATVPILLLLIVTSKQWISVQSIREKSARSILRQLDSVDKISTSDGGSFQVPEGPLLLATKKKKVENKKTGYIRIDEAMKNHSKYIGQRLRLYCDISGDPWPTYQWKKNGREINKLNTRVTIKQELFGSSLKIDNLRLTDSANYTCVATNDFGERNVTGRVTVRSTNRRKNANSRNNNKSSGKKANADNNDKLNSYSSFPKVQQTGFCQSFESSTCQLYIANNPVFVEHNLKQAIDEPVFLAYLRELKALKISDACLSPLIQASCFYSFPLCHSYDGVDLPKRLCRSSCIELTQSFCREDISRLQGTLKPRSQRLLPNCTTLPELSTVADGQCIRINQQPKEYSCFNGTGENYIGTRSYSQSGRPCVAWRKMRGYHKTFLTDHSFCRNPLSREQVAPWCFVSEQGERELCDIPRCSKSEADSIFLNKEILPIFIAFVVILILIGIILAMWCTCRKSKSAIGYQGMKTSSRSTTSNGYSGAPLSAAKTTNVYHNANQQNPADVEMHTAATNTYIQATEFPLTRIRFDEELGESIFGKVYKGRLVGLYSDVSINNVVLKTLQNSCTLQLETDFCHEANLMADLNHPNVLCLLGVSTCHSPWCMIFELLPGGDLHEFLTLHNPHKRATKSFNNAAAVLTNVQMLYIAGQVSAGMDYLASRQYVHRDLAARNVLIGDQLLCKVSDFGLARKMYTQDYHCGVGGVLLPIRWMSPEAVVCANFTVYSDVWSFGILMWEIWSFGLQPYYGHNNTEVMELIKARQLLTSPWECPSRIFALMVECWKEFPQHRPQFSDITATLRVWHEELLNEKDTNVWKNFLYNIPLPTLPPLTPPPQSFVHGCSATSEIQHEPESSFRYREKNRKMSSSNSSLHNDCELNTINADSLYSHSVSSTSKPLSGRTINGISSTTYIPKI